MADPKPIRRLPLLIAFALLAWVDVLGIIGFRVEDSVLTMAIMFTTISWIWIGVDLLLLAGLVFRISGSVELIRLRCFLHFGFLVYMWISYLMLLRPVGAPLFDGLAVAGMIRDGLAGFCLLGVFFLLKPKPPTLVPQES